MYSLIVFLSSLFGLTESHTSDAIIGNYSQYIPEYELCGRSMAYFESSNQCFQFHRNMENPIRGGREVLEAEAPWVVSLQIYQDFEWWKFWKYFQKNVEMECTGTLIDKQWVLTAAHCLDSFPEKAYEVKVKVWFGHKYRRDKIPRTDEPNGIKVIAQIIHPLYSQDDQIDIVLLKLAKPVPILHIDHNYITNMICLPDKYITPERDLLSFVSGWGVNHNGTLKIATRIMAGRLYFTVKNSMREPVLYKLYPVGGTGAPCSGDSGSPVWQYVYGRAVIIGVHMGTMGNGTNIWNCTTDQSSGIYVPKFINWILQTIKNSTQP